MNLEANIPARFNGPPNSGNGGYSCGVLAAHVSSPCARVRLHVPPPLDTPLPVTLTEDGGAQMHHGEILVGTAVPAALSMAIPAPPTMEQARTAMDNYAGKVGHAFPTCFVCGPGRPHHDGLALSPGAVTDNSLLACIWELRDDAFDNAGKLRPEIVWAALDCPGYFAAMEGNLRPALLGELVGELGSELLEGARSPVQKGAPLLVYSWPLGSEGRKYYGGTAITDAAGTLLGRSHSTWIELKA